MRRKTYCVVHWWKFLVRRLGSKCGLPWYIRLYNYPTEKELEADRIGLEYWKKLGWDCWIWVRILENFQNKNIGAILSTHRPPITASSERLRVPDRSFRVNCGQKTTLRYLYVDSAPSIIGPKSNTHSCTTSIT
jgi:hypothetical protein